MVGSDSFEMKELTLRLILAHIENMIIIYSFL